MAQTTGTINSRNNLVLVQTEKAGRHLRCPRDCGVHGAEVTVAIAGHSLRVQVDATS